MCAFDHRALQRSRRAYLDSRSDQVVRVNGEEVAFAAGEPILLNVGALVRPLLDDRIANSPREAPECKRLLTYDLSHTSRACRPNRNPFARVYCRPCEHGPVRGREEPCEVKAFQGRGLKVGAEEERSFRTCLGFETKQTL